MMDLSNPDKVRETVTRDYNHYRHDAGVSYYSEAPHTSYSYKVEGELTEHLEDGKPVRAEWVVK